MYTFEEAAAEKLLLKYASSKVVTIMDTLTMVNSIAWPLRNSSAVADAGISLNIISVRTKSKSMANYILQIPRRGVRHHRYYSYRSNDATWGDYESLGRCSNYCCKTNWCKPAANLTQELSDLGLVPEDGWGHTKLKFQRNSTKHWRIIRNMILLKKFIN